MRAFRVASMLVAGMLSAGCATGDPDGGVDGGRDVTLPPWRTDVQTQPDFDATIETDSGQPPRDSGPTDPCANRISCSTCTPTEGCGWCDSTNSCAQGTASGPSEGSCAVNGWRYGTCTASTTCTGRTCGECTAGLQCGWCASTSSCARGTATGPSSGTCASWAYASTQCAATTCAAKTACGACADTAGCGWCKGGAPHCAAGTSTGPSDGSCTQSSWVWASTLCP